MAFVYRSTFLDHFTTLAPICTSIYGAHKSYIGKQTKLTTCDATKTNHIQRLLRKAMHNPPAFLTHSYSLILDDKSLEDVDGFASSPRASNHRILHCARRRFNQTKPTTKKTRWISNPGILGAQTLNKNSLKCVHLASLSLVTFVT